MKILMMLTIVFFFLFDFDFPLIEKKNSEWILSPPLSLSLDSPFCLDLAIWWTPLNFELTVFMEKSIFYFIFEIIYQDESSIYRLSPSPLNGMLLSI